MTMHLGREDVRGLESAFRTMLSPLAYADPDEWRLEAMRSARSMVGADIACFCLALESRPLYLTEPALRPVITAIEDHYAESDVDLDARRREVGLEVAHVSMLFDMRAFRRSEFWSDFVVPYRLYDTTMLLADVGPGGSPAGLFFHHDEPRPAAPFGERELDLLRLLVPAVKAGVATCLERHCDRGVALRTIDAVQSALGLCDVQGRMVHANPAFVRLLREDSLPEKLLWASRTTARECLEGIRAGGEKGSCPKPWRLIRTPAGTYRLCVSLLGWDELAVISIERHGDDGGDPDALRRRFGLSPRQAEVAILLVARKTNAEIASELGISAHTARRHTEQVLLRLGVRSRRDVRNRVLRS